MVPAYRFPAAALIALVLGAAAAAQGDAAGAARKTELDAARAALRKEIEKEAKKLLAIADDRPVAWLELRPIAEGKAGAEVLAPLQAALFQVLFKKGILAARIEGSLKAGDAYRSGRLKKGFPLEEADAEELKRRGYGCLAYPQLVVGESGVNVQLEVYELLKTHKKVLEAAIGPIETKRFAMTELADLRVLPDLNVAVLEFALANLGRQVDGGECWDLPATILHERGGKVDGYDFGTEVAWEDALPGDVLTYGSGGATGGHVMVLARWNKLRSSAVILHQNVGSARYVIRDTLGSDPPGQAFRVWRPEPEAKRE